MINARMETVADKPAFRRAFAKRRALLPADGYFEWYGEERGKKQPFFIRPADGGVLAMAGLYELWRDPAKEDDDPDRWLWTCTVLTTSATDELGRIHDRMPLLVERKRYGTWLDPDLDDPQSLRELLVPAAPGLLTAYPVSKAVGNVRNNSPALVEPLPVEESPGPGDDPALF
jgi:putative SOS response-associated peptidase YedK